jgi:hypothetical protein
MDWSEGALGPRCPRRTRRTASLKEESSKLPKVYEVHGRPYYEVYGRHGGREPQAALCVQGVWGVRPARREGVPSCPMCPRWTRCTTDTEEERALGPYVSKVYEVYGRHRPNIF